MRCKFGKICSGARHEVVQCSANAAAGLFILYILPPAERHPIQQSDQYALPSDDFFLWWGGMGEIPNSVASNKPYALSYAPIGIIVEGDEILKAWSVSYYVSCVSTFTTIRLVTVLYI